MAYTLDIAVILGSPKTGLSDLRAQLVDTAGSNVGSAVSTGFVEIGTSGSYLWHYASFPDGHRGGVKFYSAAASSTILAFTAINPEEAENTDAKTSTRASQTSLDTLDDYVDTEVAAIKTKTDQLTFGTANRVDAQVYGMEADTLTSTSLAASAVTEIQSGLSTLTEAGVRTAVGLAAASLDTQLTTIDDLLDTEIAAIKAKTDNLPADPADASDIAASFSTVNSTLATIASYVDTEVAAIKAKTDLIPASPAAVGSAMTLAAGSITSSVIADDAITDAKIAVPTETSGRPTRLLAMMRRAWEWVANKRTRDRDTGTVLLRNAADDATLETQTQSTASNVDTQTKGV